MKILNEITLRGFKSIKSLDNFRLNSLNVLIGSNGSGKSNFISVFEMLNHIIDGRLNQYVQQNGRTSSLLYFGPKYTHSITLKLSSERNSYEFSLIPTVEDSLIFEKETADFITDIGTIYNQSLGTGHTESKLKTYIHKVGITTVAHYVYDIVSTLKVYHFNDTSSSSKVRQACNIEDNFNLRNDAGNLSAFLYLMKQKYESNYRTIIDNIQFVAPFFDDFILEPSQLNPEEIKLLWKHKNSDEVFGPHTLSDGTLRFICLTTLFNLPNPPNTIILDEPELGLHPFAIALLSENMKAFSKKHQLIISTQSVSLVNKFEPEDIVIVERKDDQTILTRPSGQDIHNWLDDYALGDLWEKNVLGGTP